MLSISIIGPGRIGGALALSFPKEKYWVKNLIYRGDRSRAASLQKALPTAAVTTLDETAELNSDIVFITTQDSSIGSTCKQLSSKSSGHPIVLHTSGALSSSVLADLRSSGCTIGSMHPLVSISSVESGPERFRGAYFCIEGDPKAVEFAEQIATSIGGLPFTIDTKFKTLYHAAAVTACGHLVALFDAAVEMMSKTGLSAEESKTILLPLVNSTVQNLARQGTAAALTGTFARADIETFVEHLRILNTTVSDELLEIYLLLGERSLELTAKQGVSADRVESLRTKVSIAKSKLKW